MVTVKLFKGEDPNHAIKRLRRKLQKENTLKELFNRRFFKSKGLENRERRKRAIFLGQLQAMRDKAAY